MLATVAVLVIVLILSVILVIALILIALLILVVHCKFLRLYHLGYPKIVCPYTQDLSFGRKIRLTNRPATIAAVMPPAVDRKPPVNIPIMPSFAIASFTPFASV